MASYLLDSARSKLARAETNLEAIYLSVQGFLDDNPYTFSRDYTPNGRQYTVFAHARAQPPVAISLLIGEFAHNLRSALDHALYELALFRLGDRKINAKIRGYLRRSQMPILSDDRDWKESSPVLGLLQPEDRAIIKSEQPFSGLGLNDPLWHLSAINNQDKHRAIHLVGGQVSNVTFGFRRHAPQKYRGLKIDLFTLGRGPIEPIEEKTPLYAVIFNRPIPDDPSMDVDFIPSIQIFFSKDSDAVADQPIGAILTAIPGRVRSVVEKIQAQFP